MSNSPCSMSLRCGFLVRSFLVLGVAALCAGDVARAQFSQPAGSYSSNIASAGESTSLASLYGSFPAAPSAAGSAGGGGQYQSHKYTPRLSWDRMAVEAGGGFNSPIGHDTAFLTFGGNLTLGAGLAFTKRLSLLAEYQFIDDKLPAAFINASGNAGGGGNAHIWSFTLDPMVDLLPNHTNSVYVTGGGGFYRKLTSFTVLVCCDFYGYAVSETAAHFSSNQGGWNAGVGYTHRLGGVNGDGRMKLYGEIRYLDVKTPEYNAFTGPTPMGDTETLPVTFGLRW